VLNINVESYGLSAVINGSHLFSVLSYSALQVFWHFNQCWLSDHDAHPLAGPLEQHLVKAPTPVGWCQDNGNRSNQESKFDFLATRKCLGKIGEGQQKIKIVRTNRQSNLRSSCQSIFSLSLGTTLLLQEK